jgi:hypothetical protein
MRKRAPRSDSDGRGERIVACLRERPGASNHWLAEQVYGENTAKTRQALMSLLGYLRDKKKTIHRRDGKHFAGPDPEGGAK